MSSKIYVLDGALLQCDQGFTPGKLLVTENQKVKIQGKFAATDMDVQIPQTFGQCKLKPSGSSYLPCVPALQKWTKTSEKATLGKTKGFLFEDSECMCATGGKITVLQPMQVNTAGIATAEFKNMAMTIPGALLGNDKAPKVLQSYWMDENGNEKLDEIEYGDKAAIFALTENTDPGETVMVSVKDTNGLKIDGKRDAIVFSGTVKADGTVALKPLESKEDWNGEKRDGE